MELCPICGSMTAETNHYTGKLVCFNRYCGPEWRRKREEEERKRKMKARKTIYRIKIPTSK